MSDFNVSIETPFHSTEGYTEGQMTHSLSNIMDTYNTVIGTLYTKI